MPVTCILQSPLDSVFSESVEPKLQRFRERAAALDSVRNFAETLKSARQLLYATRIERHE